jgi:hypothetical protein
MNYYSTKIGKSDKSSEVLIALKKPSTPENYKFLISKPGWK